MTQHQNESESSNGSNGNTSSSRESVWDDDMSLEDHNVVVGFPAGTLASIFMGNTATAASTATTATDANNQYTTSAAVTAANNGSIESGMAMSTNTTVVTSDDSSFDRTILSSTPSEEIDYNMVMTAVPSALTSISSVQTFPDLLHDTQDPVAVSYGTAHHPYGAAGDSSFISISTTASEYRYVEWPSEIFTSNRSSQHHNGMDLSMRPSMVDSCSSVMSTPSSTSIVPSASQQSLTHHGSAVFVHVGQHLTQCDVEPQQQFVERRIYPIRQNLNSRSVWYEGFDDADWEQFRQAGQMVLNAILESEGTASDNVLATTPLRLPLTDSLADSSLDLTKSTQHDGYEPAVAAREVLPVALLCPLCHDVMVGATVLDCGCAASAVCAECWQVHVDHNHALALADTRRADVVVESDFVWVSALPSATPESLLSSCPTCHMRVHRVVVCHALEAAIQEFLRKLPPTHDSLKRHYRQRFSRWRETCLQLQASQRAALDEQHRNQLLSQMIAREEEVLWKCHKPSYWRRCGQILTSEPFMLLMAAAISVGFAMKAGARK